MRQNNSFLIIAAACLLAFAAAFFSLFSEGRWSNIISSDGKGYYAYIASLSLDGDLNYKSVSQYEYQRYDSSYACNYLVKHHGSLLNKYPIGTSILMSPFAISAIGFNWLFHSEISPYGPFAQYSVLLASCTYLLLGFYWLDKLFKQMGFKFGNRLFVCLAGLFGTSLYFYAAARPAMSHVYTFSLLSGLLYYAFQVLHFARYKMLKWVLILSSLLVLIRLNNVLLLFSIFCLKPWFSPQLNNTQFWKSFAKGLPIAFILLLLVPLSFFIQCGEFFTWPYKGEGFYFSNPQFTEVWFGFRRGLFIYAPVFFLLIPLFFKIRTRWKYAGLLLFLLISYLHASWWNWYYGDGFGHRAFIDLYPIMLLYLAWGLEQLRTFAQRFFLISIGSLLSLLTLFQGYQYSFGILDPYDMDRQKYRACFLEIKASPGLIRATHDLPLYGKLNQNPLAFVQLDPIETDAEYLATVEQTPCLPQTNEALYLSANGQLLEISADGLQNLMLVFDQQDEQGQSVNYQSWPVKRVLKESLTIVKMGINIEKFHPGCKKFKIYLWNKDKVPFKVLKLEMALQQNLRL